MTKTRDRTAGGPAKPRFAGRAFVLGGFALAALCAFVLGGFALAALYTLAAVLLGAGLEAVGPLWLAAGLWAAISSLALALRSGFRDGDWSAFRDFEPPDNTDTIDWSTESGAWFDMAIAEEQERLMRQDWARQEEAPGHGD